MRGKEKWGVGEGDKEGEKWGKVSTYTDGMGQSFLLNLACFYEWHCMTMCTCIIVIVNLPAE